MLAPVAAFAEHERGLQFILRPWLATVYLAVVGSAVTFPLYFWLLARRSAVSAALISYTAPVIALAIGVFLFDEPVTRRLLLGAAVVLAGVAFALRPAARPVVRPD
jgi:drug/metabolite transporter (DMT)-like permease